MATFDEAFDIWREKKYGPHPYPIDAYTFFGVGWRAAIETSDELARLRAEVEAWHECAQYDALMEGPHFKGWDRSALDRCRHKFIDAARAALAPDGKGGTECT